MRPYRSVLFGGGVFIALAALVAFGRCSQTPPTARKPPLRWGIYQIYWSRDYADRLARELSLFASKPDYVMFYRDLSRPFPKVPIDCIAKHGATTIVSLELWLWHGQKEGSYLPAIHKGTQVGTGRPHGWPDRAASLRVRVQRRLVHVVGQPQRVRGRVAPRT